MEKAPVRQIKMKTLKASPEKGPEKPPAPLGDKIFFFFFNLNFFLAALHGLSDLSSPTTDQTRVLTRE